MATSSGPSKAMAVFSSTTKEKHLPFMAWWAESAVSSSERSMA